jgi:hypothetical protein
VNHFLAEALDLVDRTMAAIVSEYDGHEELFNIVKIDTDEIEALKSPENGDQLGKAQGYVETESFSLLSKRILHAMFTNDKFTVVLGGHSSAAGHGNHFNQSSMIQMDAVMRPLFKNLGVDFVARNMAMGSFGTMQVSPRQRSEASARAKRAQSRSS